jgi:hypothetical protein
MNIVEIFKAWSISFDPSKEQNELAAIRMKICDSCEAKETNPIIYCKDCGCPLSKKVFTPYMNRCPRAKWNDDERKYFEKNNVG